jgi:glycosyltransferase involved in cell wall biosynthesis
MKILFAITKSNLGGAQRYVLELATAAHKAGNEVLVVCGGHGALVEKLKEANISVRTISALGRDVSMFKDLASLHALRAVIKEFRPDAIQLNSSKIGGLGAVAARTTFYSGQSNSLRRPKIIFTAHGWAFNEDRSFIQRLVIKILHYVTIILSDVTIAVSNAMVNPYKKWPLAASRIHVVYNGVPEFELISREGARALFAQEGFDFTSFPFVVGMLSELHPIKGIDYAMRAIAHIPDAALVVCGEGLERQKLEKLRDELNLNDHVFFAGYVADARTRLRAFDTFLMSSNSEAFAYAALEAGYAGVPTIVTRVGGLPEAVTEAHGYVVPPRNARAIADAIEEIRTNPEKAAAKAALQAQRIREQFSMEKMKNETLATLSDASIR